MSKKSSSNTSPAKKDTDKNTKKKSSSWIVKLLVVLPSLFVAVAAYFIYNVVTSQPEVPKLDPNYWWGPYPIDQNPDTSIRPFKIEFSDVVINDLRERLLHQKPLVPPLEGAGFTYGFNTNFLSQILDYWKNKYNFKEREAFFNKYDHFKTKIQGLDIHFMRITARKEPGETALPLLLLHGWPGSIREFYELIPKLTMVRPGYKFGFDVIVPSLPGFGFSQAPSRPGLAPTEMAVIMHNLMQRLGYKNYYVQGGDIGHMIGAALSTLYGDSVMGFHTNAPAVSHRLAPYYSILGAIWPTLLVEPELVDRISPLSEHISFLIEESGYYHLQATKPDTVGVALTDSPAGLAAYILEKFSTWTNRNNRQAHDGNLLDKFSLTHLLDNIMVYWVTNSITTSMRVYAEMASARHMALGMDDIPTEVPTAGLKLKHEIIFMPDAVLKLKYKNYLQSTVVDEGGHFAALELPDLLADDVFLAVDKFLQYHVHTKDPVETEQPKPEDYENAKTIYEFTVKDINGREVKLDKYRRHVVIIVNVASECGLTDTNYKELNELYEKYGRSKGLRILAFPCNQFGSQEPGNSKDIFKFTNDRGVKFDLFEKVEVNGENAHPLWKFLKRVQKGTLGDSIKWNFSKFIVDKNGVPVERLSPTVNPMDMESYLAKYW